MILPDPVAVTSVAGLAGASLPCPAHRPDQAGASSFAEIVRSTVPHIPDPSSASTLHSAEATVGMPQGWAVVSPAGTAREAVLGQVASMGLVGVLPDIASVRLPNAGVETPGPMTERATRHFADFPAEREPVRRVDADAAKDAETSSVIISDGAAGTSIGLASDPPASVVRFSAPATGIETAAVLSSRSLTSSDATIPPADPSVARTPLSADNDAQVDPAPSIERPFISAAREVLGRASDQVTTAPTLGEPADPRSFLEAAPIVTQDDTPPVQPRPVPSEHGLSPAYARHHNVTGRDPGRDPSVPSSAFPVTRESPRGAVAVATAPARTEQRGTTNQAGAPAPSATGSDLIGTISAYEQNAPTMARHSSGAADALEGSGRTLLEAERTGAVAVSGPRRPDKPHSALPDTGPDVPPAPGDAARTGQPAQQVDQSPAAAAPPASLDHPSRTLPGGDRSSRQSDNGTTAVAAGTETAPAPIRGTEAAPDQRAVQSALPVSLPAHTPAAEQLPLSGGGWSSQGMTNPPGSVPFMHRTETHDENRSSSAGSGPVPMPVSVQIAEAAGKLGDGRIELTLSPEELGQVRLHLTTTETNAIVSVSADRVDTLDLIRRHLDDLTRDFRAIGYQDVTFQFSHGDPGQQHGRTGQSRPQLATDGQDAPAPTTRPTATYNSKPERPLNTDASLDLRL